MSSFTWNVITHLIAFLAGAAFTGYHWWQDVQMRNELLKMNSRELSENGR